MLGLGCSQRPCKEGAVGNALSCEGGTLTKKGMYLMAMLGTSVPNNYRGA